MQPPTILGLAACLTACSLASTTAVPQRWAPAMLSSDQYESSPTFTPDGREVFFMRSDPGFSRYRILWSRCEDGAWTAPVEAPFSAPKPAQEADPFVAADGTQLYYVSSRHDPRGEDLDIWRVARAHDGSWGAPERLPPPVNSADSELLPRARGRRPPVVRFQPARRPRPGRYLRRQPRRRRPVARRQCRSADQHRRQ